MEKVLKIAPKDNVVVAIENINAGEEFSFDGVFEEILSELGEMPLPPYIKAKLEDKERYHYRCVRLSSVCPKEALFR